MTIQRAFGLIPRIIGKGDSAKVCLSPCSKHTTSLLIAAIASSQRLSDLLLRLRRELPPNTNIANPLAVGSIDSIIIIDRLVDMVTPFCTQLTYEGLVDEVMGIKNCKSMTFDTCYCGSELIFCSTWLSAHVEVDPSLLNPAPVASTSTPSATAGFNTALPKKKKHLLASTDTLFSELRDKNFAVVGGILNKTARRLNDDYEKRHLAKTPAELRQFVGQLSGLQLEHQALRLRRSILPLPDTHAYAFDTSDTGLTEQIMAVTATDEFNTALEIQQSMMSISHP